MADPDLQVSEGGGWVGGLTHLDPEIRGLGGGGGGLKKIGFFWPFRPQFGLKIRGEGPSLDPPLRQLTACTACSTFFWQCVTVYASP